MNSVSSGIDLDNSPSRYEIKMVFSGLQSDLLRSLIWGHSLLFKKTYPSRQVNNIYFDTEDFQLKNDHIQGAQRRIKIRQRWYHDTWKLSNSQLEIKSKSGNLGSKKVLPISSEIDLTNITWNEFRKVVLRNPNHNVQLQFINTRPVLINRYQREYFESADQIIRITLDTGLISLNQVFGDCPNLDRTMPMRNVCVLEIKADSSHHLEIASALEEFPQYCTAYSKYIHGIETIPL
jgi:hypothetical protein